MGDFSVLSGRPSFRPACRPCCCCCCTRGVEEEEVYLLIFDFLVISGRFPGPAFHPFWVFFFPREEKEGERGSEMSVVQCRWPQGDGAKNSRMNHNSRPIYHRPRLGIGRNRLSLFVFSLLMSISPSMLHVPPISPLGATLGELELRDFGEWFDLVRPNDLTRRRQLTKKLNMKRERTWKKKERKKKEIYTRSKGAHQ